VEFDCYEIQMLIVKSKLTCYFLFLVFCAGSFSVSVLSGKVMFRDVYFITKNYSVRIQLGLAIFRWWRPLTHKKVNEGMCSSC